MSRPVHFEILTSNPEAIATFYRDVFGWQFEQWDGPRSYWVMTTGPENRPGINGGIMGAHLPQPVINTLRVDSMTKAIADVEAAGGKIVMGPNAVRGVGSHAYAADPDGNIFGLLEPAPGQDPEQ